MINDISARIVTRIYHKLQSNKSAIWLGGVYHPIKITDNSKSIIYNNHQFIFFKEINNVNKR